MNNTTIAILTTTRAEYGLLKPVIEALLADENISTRVLVTGMHLSTEFGYTYGELEEDGIQAAVKIPILLSNDTPSSSSKSMGLAIIGFADYFSQERIDLLVVLGDRFETFAVCCAAFNANIPIAHLHGGETTQGAQDEGFRHAITKMSMLHFTSTDDYRRRVIQLGEAPSRVFNVGAIGVENALKLPLLSRDLLANEVSDKLKFPYAVVTFHPETLEQESALEQCNELLKALDKCNERNYLVTKANADAGGRLVNAFLEDYAIKRSNIILVDSLGVRRYLSALKYAEFVIGNSSSGLIEAPSFGIPTINIGDRQLGRVQSDSVLNCPPESIEISRAIHRAMENDFRNAATKVANPYQGNHPTQDIINQIKLFVRNPKSIKKQFYDIVIEESI